MGMLTHMFFVSDGHCDIRETAGITGRKRIYKKRRILDPSSLSGAKEDRTPDPLLAKQVLSQLSYNPMYI